MSQSWNLARLMLCAYITVAWIPAQVKAGCGGYIDSLADGASYTISSPNYPSNYDRNANCIWLYSATNFTELQVNVSFVDLETNSDDSCKDYLLITEGNSTANVLGMLCSSSSPTQLSTLNRYLWIQFRSDYQVQGRGFQLTITARANQAANSTSSPIQACQLTQYSCANKQCVETAYVCDDVNDCGCTDYNCDESKCWTFKLLESVSFNWGVGVSIGFFIGLLLLIIFGLYEMPQHKRPECLKRNRGSTEVPENACLLACTQRCKRNKVDQKKPGDQFKSMLEKMSAAKHPLRWETESESDIARSGANSRRTSASGPGSLGGSRRSSYQLSVGAAAYGNTLSPTDMPLRPTGAANPAAAAAAASLSPRSAGGASTSQSPKKLAVPAVTPV